MLNPRTTRLRARPGKKTGHQVPERASSRLGPVMSAPQEGTGGWTPTPRKLTAASARIARGSVMLARITMSAATLGRMCRHMMRESLAPMALAASM